MLWFMLCLVGLALLAGAGGKWAIDRIWPPAIERLAAYDRGFADGRDTAQLQPRSPKVTMLDDTMDVLGAGYEAGYRQGRHVRPGPAGIPDEPEDEDPYAARSPFTNDDSAGWVSGPGLQAGPLPRSMVYRDDPVIPAAPLTAGYAEQANGQQPAGGGV